MLEKRVYIKIEQNNEVNKKRVCFKDIGKAYCTDKKVAQAVDSMVIYQFKDDENQKIMFSVMKVIEKIDNAFPAMEVVNMGETDFIISYQIPNRKNIFWEYAKVYLLCFIVGCGAAFSIMTFNTDVSVSDVFTKTYEIVIGDGAKSNGIVELAYSIGLPIGICIFFNHFSKKAMSSDPTPLQVEMRIYEEEVNKALIKEASREGNTIDVDG